MRPAPPRLPAYTHSHLCPPPVRALGAAGGGALFWRGLPSRVALKCIEHVFSSTTDARRALREISIMRQCNHNNIIKLRPGLLRAQSDGRVCVGGRFRRRDLRL